MELKGIIKYGENKGLTCCASISDIIIGEASLFDELQKLFNQDAEQYFEANYDQPKQSPKYGVKYVVLDEQPIKEKSFNDLSCEIQQNMIYADFVCGCYSEYTCGYGGFDYVLGKDGKGHSVFEELGNHIGKYIHFKI